MIKKLKAYNHPSLDFKYKARWFISSVLLYIPFPIRDFYYKHIKTLWKPQHSRIRKAIPKYWYDLDHILLVVNFEIIKSFYEDEFKKDTVDWEGTGGDAMKFVAWLERAYAYITSVRPVLEKRIEEALDKSHYKKVEKLEQEMEDKDTEVLIDLVKWRGHMWT